MGKRTVLSRFNDFHALLQIVVGKSISPGEKRISLFLCFHENETNQEFVGFLQRGIFLLSNPVH